MNIQQALAASAVLNLPRLDAQLLLLHALGRPQSDRAWLLAHDCDALDPQAEQRFIALARRRAAGVPLAYLTGIKEFFGLPLQIDARVLDPRPDTETLVEWALEVLAPLATPRVIDLGTGSGAIALALKHMRPDAQVSAVDASIDALSVAHANAQQLGLALALRQGDWLNGIQEKYDLIVSNPPYIANNDPHLEKLGHEPLQALASGADGLDDIRKIVAQARFHLEPGGWLLLEHGWDQAPVVRDLLLTAGLDLVQSRPDLGGIERCSGGQLPL